jgi:hypothetical protein
MTLKRDLIEREIAGSTAAIETHSNGIKIHSIVLRAFREELKKCPIETTKKEEEKNTKSANPSEKKAA